MEELSRLGERRLLVGGPWAGEWTTIISGPYVPGEQWLCVHPRDQRRTVRLFPEDFGRSLLSSST